MKWTNRGKKRFLEWIFRGVAMPASFYVALVDSTPAPGPTTTQLSDLDEITAGNGYTAGGYQLNPDTTDFDTIVQDDTNNLAKVQAKDVIWTATGGNLPNGGNPARYAVLLDDNATPANREVLAYWDLGSDQTRTDGQPLTLQDLTLRLKDS